MPVYQFTATDQTWRTLNREPLRPLMKSKHYAQLAQYGLTVSKVLPMEPTLPASPAPRFACGTRSRKSAKNKKKAESGKRPQASQIEKEEEKGWAFAFELGGGPNSEDISIFTRQMSTLFMLVCPC